MTFSLSLLWGSGLERQATRPMTSLASDFSSYGVKGRRDMWSLLYFSLYFSVQVQKRDRRWCAQVHSGASSRETAGVVPLRNAGECLISETFQNKKKQHPGGGY